MYYSLKICKSLRRCTIFSQYCDQRNRLQSRFIALVTKGNTQTTTLAYLHRDLAGDDLLLLEIVAVTVYSDSGVASGKLSFYLNA